MSAYVARLRATQANIEHHNAKDVRATADAARQRLMPLDDRLARLLLTIPAEVQREGLSLPALQASLRGRWRGNAHPGELGRALRKAGFVRKRDWSGENGSGARWFKKTRSIPDTQ